MIATSHARTFGPRREAGPDVVRPLGSAAPLILRHLARLLFLRKADARAIASGDLRGPVLRLARDLVPTTLLALVPAAL